MGPNYMNIGVLAWLNLQCIMRTCPFNVDPLPPTSNSITGVYRGIHYFIIFTLKYRLWVLIEAVLTCTNDLCFEQKLEKYHNFSSEN